MNALNVCVYAYGSLWLRFVCFPLAGGQRTAPYFEEEIFFVDAVANTPLVVTTVVTETRGKNR